MAAADAIVEHRFRIMGSDAHVIVVGRDDPGAARLADRFAPVRLGELEACWSRFLASSDLCRLAEADGAWCDVHPDTITLVDHMQRGAIATVGRYDPTLAAQLAAAGHAPSVALAPMLAPRVRGSVLDVDVDRSGSRIRTPPGLALDPGGIGKGLAADLVSAELVAAGATGALVSVGGDLVAAGTAPDPDGWPIVVESADGPGAAPLGRIAIDAGGVATSSTRSNRWIVDGGEAHHVIDPESGRPSMTDLAAVTVVAPTGWQAEVHATAALLDGSDGAIAYLRSRGLAGVAVTLDGTVVATDDLAELASRR